MCALFIVLRLLLLCFVGCFGCYVCFALFCMCWLCRCWLLSIDFAACLLFRCLLLLLCLGLLLYDLRFLGASRLRLLNGVVFFCFDLLIVGFDLNCCGKLCSLIW